MWDFASSVLAVIDAIWAIAASMCDAQVLCGLLHPLYGLLQPSCLMHRRYVGYYSLFVGCYGLYVSCYSLYAFCAYVMLSVTSSMRPVASYIWAVTASIHDA